MDDLRELVKGETLDGLPGELMNYCYRAAKQVHAAGNSGFGVGAVSGATTVGLEVVNVSGADFTARFPIVRLVKPQITSDDNAEIVGEGVLWEADVPDADTTTSDIVILYAPCGDGMAAGGTLLGPCWCDVDVVSESDTHAAPIDGDAAKLRSGSSGAKIRWKPTGTGVKRCLVVLGGGGGGGGALAVIAFTYVVEVGEEPGDDYRVASPWGYTPPVVDPPSPAIWDLNSSWQTKQGDLTPLQVLDEEDQPASILVADDWFEWPQVGDKVLIISDTNSGNFQTIRKTCAGA